MYVRLIFQSRVTPGIKTSCSHHGWLLKKTLINVCHKINIFHKKHIGLKLKQHLPSLSGFTVPLKCKISRGFTVQTIYFYMNDNYEQNSKSIELRLRLIRIDFILMCPRNKLTVESKCHHFENVLFSFRRSLVTNGRMDHPQIG